MTPANLHVTIGYLQGVPPKRTHPLTDPESPAIKRSRLESPKSDKKNSSYRAAPVPDFSKVFKVKYPDRPFLMPCPFSFEEREKNKSVQKQVEQNVRKSLSMWSV